VRSASCQSWPGSAPGWAAFVVDDLVWALPSRWNGVNIPIPVGLGDARPAVDHAQLDPLAAVARRQ
jgi:hypothetical protein